MRTVHGRDGLARQSGRRSAFTLVELLVVIGLIGVLIGILLPSLAKAREAARSVQCKSLLRQYALAFQMYQNEANGVAVDAYKTWDYGYGLAKYLSQKNGIPEQMTRCPADNDARLATLGGFASTGVVPSLDQDASTDPQLRTLDGTVYHPRVSFGINANVFSDSRRVSGGVSAARWVKPSKFRSAAGATTGSGMAGMFDPTRIAVFGDYMNNPRVDIPTLPMLIPTDLTTDPGTKGMGSVPYRHNGSANMAFLDGHVGTIRPSGIKLTHGGLEMQPGQDWATGYTGAKPLPKHYYLMYPFGPGWEGNTARLVGSYPNLRID